MEQKPLDKTPRISLAKPDAAILKQATRWIKGAARLLADASNGDPLVERLALETTQLGVVAEIALHEHLQ